LLVLTAGCNRKVASEQLPPPGWKVTPSEYKISKNTKRVDFEMEKVGK